MSDSTLSRETAFVRKLQNSSFEKFKGEQGIINRERAKNVELGSSSVEHASGSKLQDTGFLTECISTTTISSACRRQCSKFQLFWRYTKREGRIRNTLENRHLSGKGGGTHEVTCRSVPPLQHLGLTGLSRFCVTMICPLQ